MIVSIVLLIISVVVHELAHGYVAYILGDSTAKRAGRLSLNPIVHMDLVGSFLLPGMAYVFNLPVMIGWAKPVPINPLYFRSPYRDMMIVALAGPLSNFLMGIMGVILYRLLPDPFVQSVLVKFVYLNVILGCFNLIPIPPLDGSRILACLLPDKGREMIAKMEPYGFFLVLIFAYLGILSNILVWTSTPVLHFFERLLL